MTRSQANGSLMRASPLGVLRAPHERRDAAAALGRADSALTHPHPVCGDAVAAFVVAVAHAIDHGDGGEAAYGAALRLGARGAGRAVGARGARSRRRDGAPRATAPPRAGC